MVTPDQIRQIALSFPETEELPHHERTSFRVKGTIFATMLAEDNELNLRLTADHVDTLVGINPLVYAAIEWDKTKGWLRVELEKADLGELEDLLVDAWFERAPIAVANVYRDELLS